MRARMKRSDQAGHPALFVLVGIIWMSTGKNTREPKGEMLLEHKTNKDYNNYLYEHHLITEEEKRKMQRKIERQGGGLGW